MLPAVIHPKLQHAPRVPTGFFNGLSEPTTLSGTYHASAVQNSLLTVLDHQNCVSMRALSSDVGVQPSFNPTDAPQTLPALSLAKGIENPETNSRLESAAPGAAHGWQTTGEECSAGEIAR